MTQQQESQFDNYLRNSASEQDKSNLRGHAAAAGDDDNHNSAHTVRNWVAGLLSVPAAGLSWFLIKKIINRH